MDNGEACRRFEEYVRRRSPDRRTPVDYLSDIRQFQRACAKSWDAVTVADIDGFVDQMRQVGLKGTTIRRRVIALKVYFDFLAEEEGCLGHANPVRLRRYAGRPSHRLPRSLSDGEVQRLLAVVTGARDRALVVLMLRAGLRVSEVVGLSMDDVLLPITAGVPSRLRVLGKGQKERVVYLSPEATQVLVEWLIARPVCETPAVFVSERHRPLSVAGVEWLLKGYGEQVGLHLTPHRLRHTCARQLIEAEMPVESLAHLLGHAQISTTQIYLEGADTGLRKSFLQAMQRVESAGPALEPGASPGLEEGVRERVETAASRSGEAEYAPVPDGQDWAKELPEPIRRACLDYVRRHLMGWRPSQRREQAQNVLGLLAGFWRWIVARRSLTRIADLTVGDLQAYIDDRLSHGLKASSVNSKLARILGFLRELEERGEPISPGLFRVKRPQVPDALPRALTEEAARRLEVEAKQWLTRGTRQAVRDAACFFLLAHTGMRVGELLDLRRRDLDLERRTVHVSGKGGHDRIVYLTDMAVQALQRHLALWPDAPQALLFVSLHGERLVTRSFRERLNALAAAAQVGRVTPHQLRHTLATRLINAGMPITGLQKVLGHDYLSTTQIYARVYDATVERDYRDAMARLQADAAAQSIQDAPVPYLASERVAALALDNSV